MKHISTEDISNSVEDAEIVHVKPQCFSCKTGNMEEEITSWENLFHGSLTDYLRKHEADHFDGTFSSSNTICNSSIHDAEGPPNLPKSWNSPSITISCDDNSSTRKMNQSVGHHADDQKKAESMFKRRKLGNRQSTLDRQSSSDPFILMDIIEELDESRSRAGSAGSRNSFTDDGDTPRKFSIEITGNSIGALGTGIHSLGQDIPRRLSLEIISNQAPPLNLNRSRRASLVEDLTENEHEMVILSRVEDNNNKK